MHKRDYILYPVPSGLTQLQRFLRSVFVRFGHLLAEGASTEQRLEARKSNL